MNMYARLCGAAVLLWAFAADAADAPPRPIALVGASYGRHEVKSIIKNVLSGH